VASSPDLSGLLIAPGVPQSMHLPRNQVGGEPREIQSSAGSSALEIFSRETIVKSGPATRSTRLRSGKMLRHRHIRP
jgi:hypothetical protein